MSEIVDLDKIMKDVAALTVDSMLIPPEIFDTELDATKYYQNHLDSILAEFNKSFKTDLQDHITKQITHT